MGTKRIRVFAGPNGSGKTTIINDLKEKIPFGKYVNADDIEKEILSQECLDIKQFDIHINTDDIREFFRDSAFSPAKLKDPDLWKLFDVKEEKIYLNKRTINSYIAADIAEFLRLSLLNAGISFSYETVMSHTGKLDLMLKAKEAGYKVYLYYIATEDPEININRVKIRVAQNGHNVNPETITNRYFRSLENLKAAIKLTDRAFIFDNSGKISFLLAEITNGKEVEVFDEETVPNWFIKYIY